MIIWIASYPKSGNTYIRSFLASYYFSQDGKFDFDQLLKIHQFPNMKFSKFKSNDKEEASRNWLYNQNSFFDKKNLNLVKTHNCLYPFKTYPKIKKTPWTLKYRAFLYKSWNSQTIFKKMRPIKRWCSYRKVRINNWKKCDCRNWWDI